MMVLQLPAHLYDKMGLSRLSIWFHCFRTLQFVASVAFMGLFLGFVLNLPRGATASHHMVPVYGLVRRHARLRIVRI